MCPGAASMQSICDNQILSIYLEKMTFIEMSSAVFWLSLLVLKLLMMNLFYYNYSR